MKIGILAIQGDYEAHAKVLDRLGVEHVFVRRPEDLAGLTGVILPGGESSTHLKIMTEEGCSTLSNNSQRTAEHSSAPARGPSCWRVKFTARRRPRSVSWTFPCCGTATGASSPAMFT